MARLMKGARFVSLGKLRKETGKRWSTCGERGEVPRRSRKADILLFVVALHFHFLLGYTVSRLRFFAVESYTKENPSFCDPHCES